MCESVRADSPSAADQQRILQTYITLGMADMYYIYMYTHVSYSVPGLLITDLMQSYGAETHAHMHDFHANRLIPSEPPMQKKHNYIAARHPRAGERSDMWSKRRARTGKVSCIMIVCEQNTCANQHIAAMAQHNGRPCGSAC